MTKKPETIYTPEEIAEAERAHAADLQRLASMIHATAPEVPPAPKAPARFKPKPEVAQPSPTIRRSMKRPEVDYSGLEDRAELGRTEPFKDYATDDLGNPCVVRLSFHCRACGHQWSDNWSDATAPADCPNCVEEGVKPSAVWEWVGPDSQTAMQAWMDLPMVRESDFEDLAPEPAPHPADQWPADAPRAEQPLQFNRIPAHPEGPTNFTSIIGRTHAQIEAARDIDPAKEAMFVMQEAIKLSRAAGIEPDTMFRAAEGDLDERYLAEIVTRSAPRWAWETMDETLAADARSNAFTNELRMDIAKAIFAIVMSSEDDSATHLTETKVAEAMARQSAING